LLLATNSTLDIGNSTLDIPTAPYAHPTIILAFQASEYSDE